MTGGTGSIGGALIQVLRARGHDVTCLVRSSDTERTLGSAGFKTLRGDITTPERWIDAVTDFDAVVPVAITWADDMGLVDHHLTTLLLEALATPLAEKSLIYTSGCWVYGATGNQVATETSPHDTASEFAWGSSLSRTVQGDSNVRGMVILPAMVYERDGGVLDSMITDATDLKKIRLVGSAATRWPMVHRLDLAVVYALMLERGQAGAVYNAAATEGLEVGKIAAVLSRRYGLSLPPQVIPVEEAVRVMGSWASGYSIDQQMSGDKAMRDLGWSPEFTDVLAELA